MKTFEVFLGGKVILTTQADSIRDAEDKILETIDIVEYEG